VCPSCNAAMRDRRKTQREPRKCPVSISTDV
jgi:hypothetical protein